MEFHPHKDFFFIQDFVEIQRKSFFDFLENGLIRELSKRNIIENPEKTFQIIFYPKNYRLTLPDFNPKKAILKSKTYAGRIFVPIQYRRTRVKNLPFSTQTNILTKGK